jgi:cytochrome c
MKGFIGIAFAASVVLAAPAYAVDMAKGKALYDKYDCHTCHKVDVKVVGPAYKDVAAKYKGQADAEGKLVEKVIKGGSGNWGTVPMLPHPNVPKEDIVTLVQWVLAQ